MAVFCGYNTAVPVHQHVELWEVQLYKTILQIMAVWKKKTQKLCMQKRLLYVYNTKILKSDHPIEFNAKTFVGLFWSNYPSLCMYLIEKSCSYSINDKSATCTKPCKHHGPHTPKHKVKSKVLLHTNMDCMAYYKNSMHVILTNSMIELHTYLKFDLFVIIIILHLLKVFQNNFIWTFYSLFIVTEIFLHTKE